MGSSLALVLFCWLLLKADANIPDPFCCSPPPHHCPQPCHPFWEEKKEGKGSEWLQDQDLGAGGSYVFWPWIKHAQFLEQREVGTSKAGNAFRMTLQAERCSSSTEGSQSYTTTWINRECSRFPAISASPLLFRQALRAESS